MIGLSELLAARGFVPDPRRVKLVRHTDSRVDLEALRSAGWLDIYQKYQVDPVFDRCTEIVVFLGEESAEESVNSRFVGVYDVGARLPAAQSPLPPECPHPEWAQAIKYSQNGREAEHFYPLDKRPGFEDLEDRLVIDWGDNPRQWHQWFTDRTVVEFRGNGEAGGSGATLTPGDKLMAEETVRGTRGSTVLVLLSAPP